MAKTAMDLVQAAKAAIQQISVSQAQQMLEEDSIALDVRESEELGTGQIADARHIPRGILEFTIESHPDFKDKTRPIVVYCKSGGRSALATATLQQLGYTNVYSLIGGYDAWSAALADN
ncbi:rhodanese-like domain-containing protein [Methylophaga pinxianii]|uniref:rhodanese-like domain-containing protein n=1 Tax=Methylophaga pinxianii TaxID=2881052 RepID=UPI001CF4C2B6|nr:rhodanese-like domain-containing protein [Methylophaga pinxianii]MCB2427331.1 rhodanese-like domain-containing protein [Methylophaga pinxianii]UPH44370.1 rhodanese-like domain-containing protein [Methylophaga pinxianii]